MSLPNGSASGNARTIACPAWLVLPRVNRSTAWSERGHGIHGYLRAVLSGVHPAVALAAVDEEHRETCRLVDWLKLCGDLTDIRAEVSYAVDVRARTARFLGVNIGRDYEAAALRAGAPLGEWEVPGSNDIDGTSTLTGRPTTVDAKSGFLDVEPAQENAQGLFFGAVQRFLTGAPEVDVRIAKLKPSGDIWNDSATYDAFAVDEHLDELEGALAASKEARRVYLAGGMPDVAVGGHCKWCPAMPSCPAYTNLARAIVPELASIKARVSEMTAPQCGSAWTKAKQAGEILESVLDALKARAKTEALPTDADHEVRASTYEARFFHQGDAVDLLRKLGATEEQIASLQKTQQVVKVREMKVKSAGRRIA